MRFKMKNISRLISVTIIVTALLGLAGCSTLGGPASGGSGGGSTTLVWHNDRDLVNIVPSSASDQKPLNISDAGLATYLAKLRYAHGDRQEETVFPAPVARELADPLARALAEVKPGEDVVFSAEFKDSGGNILNNLLARHTVTSGRLFYDGDKLNIIFGYVHLSVERQLKAGIYEGAPDFGQRARKSQPSLRVIGGPDTTHASSDRGDWLVVAPSVIANLASQPAPAATTTNPAQPTPAQPQSHPRTTPPQPTTQSRPTTQPQPTQQPPAAAPASSYYGEVSQRLDTLKKLRDNGDISNAEYKRLRKHVLDQVGNLKNR